MQDQKQSSNKFATLEDCPPRGSKPIKNSRFMDHEGRTYGNLDVLYFTGRKKKKSMWLCRCGLCGMYIEVSSHRLSSGKVQDCGCVPKPKKQFVKADITGLTINGWQVIGMHNPRINSHGEVLWDCICPTCGDIVPRTYYVLHSGRVKACKNCKGKNRAIDISGQKFGRLTAIRYVGTNKGQGSVWECVCECGQTVNVRKLSLTSGRTKSCGCLNRDQLLSPKKDLTGEQFGFLKVIKQMEYNSKNNGTNWLCLCENCGAETVISQHSLVHGQMSCGCIKSKSEVTITRFLKDNNINFSKQYQFDDLKSTKGYPLRFDFAIMNDDDSIKMLIEYQGQQHFEATPYWGGEEGYERRKEYDELKRTYCRNKGLNLVEITCFDNLERRLREVFYDS